MGGTLRTGHGAGSSRTCCPGTRPRLPAQVWPGSAVCLCKYFGQPVMTGSKSSICLLERKGKEAPDLVGLPGARLTREARGPRRRLRVGERGLLRGGSRCLNVRSPCGHPGSTATQSPPCHASRTLRSLPSQGACSRPPRQGPQPSYGPVTRSWKGTNLSAVSTPLLPSPPGRSSSPDRPRSQYLQRLLRGPPYAALGLAGPALAERPVSPAPCRLPTAPAQPQSLGSTPRRGRLYRGSIGGACRGPHTHPPAAQPLATCSPASGMSAPSFWRLKHPTNLSRLPVSSGSFTEESPTFSVAPAPALVSTGSQCQGQLSHLARWDVGSAPAPACDLSAGPCSPGF